MTEPTYRAIASDLERGVGPTQAAQQPNDYERERRQLIEEVVSSTHGMLDEREAWAKRVMDARADRGALEGTAQNLHETVQRLTAEREQARATAGTALSTLERYKRQVREVALRVRRDEGWCAGGFNSAMKELGLAGLPTRIYAELELTVTRRVKVVIEGSDVDDLLDEDGDADEADVLSYVKANMEQEALEADDERVPELGDVELVSAEAAAD